MKKRNKGFTLVELLITIAVIAILVLLAAPRLLGYTDKARITELTTNTRSIQDAAERYYLDHDEAEWPRLTDTPYTDDEVKAFSEKIYDITGEVVNLDPDGNYYDIDFDELKPYIDVPGEKAYYVLQNPVGKVYALHKPTQEAMERLPDKDSIRKGFSTEEIDKLINEGYIPISTSEEMNNLSKKYGQTLTFGSGTKWENEYTPKLNSHYIQTNNIDMIETENFKPIGSSSNKFSGIYNGGNYNIKNLVIDESSNFVGFFGYTNKATIENVGIVNSNIKGNQYVGGLVGYNNEKSTIKNSFVTGEVVGETGTGGLVGYSNEHSIIENSFSKAQVTGNVKLTGGLVGVLDEGSKIYNSYSTGAVVGVTQTGGLVGKGSGLWRDSLISKSYATGNVKGTGAYTGGFIGHNNNTSISESYSTGNVEGLADVGGFVGYNYSSNIIHSYSTGNVKGSTPIGGFAGSHGASSISNAYSIGLVDTNETYRVGGFVGRAYERAGANQSYYNIDIAKVNYTAGGQSKTTEEMKGMDLYESNNWDLNIWKISEGKYPKLINNLEK